jgi:RNA polymerase-binding transcription factor DksA
MKALSSSLVARDRLLARRARLLDQFRYASALADELNAEQHEVEVVDIANDQWDARVLGKLGDNETRQLSAVLAALRRVADGSYGWCLRCRVKIPAARLDTVPEAAMCNDCARYVEQRRKLH